MYFHSEVHDDYYLLKSTVPCHDVHKENVDFLDVEDGLVHW